LIESAKAAMIVAQKLVKAANDIKRQEMDKLPDEIDGLDVLEGALSVANLATLGDNGEVTSGRMDFTGIENLPEEIGENKEIFSVADIEELPDEISTDILDSLETVKDEEVSEKLYLGNSRILTENTIGIKENKGDVDQKNTDVENDELKEKKGGRYKDVKKTSDGETSEVHHMPADSASKLERDDGPAIKMEKEDHRQTASCGNSKEAREYRDRQRELIEQGKFREALQMDIDDIHDKFGDKYDDAINEMLEYVDQLEQEEKI
jgi:hypothetical protein